MTDKIIEYLTQPWENEPNIFTFLEKTPNRP